MASEVGSHVILGAAKNLSSIEPIQQDQREILRCAQNDMLGRFSASTYHVEYNSARAALSIGNRAPQAASNRLTDIPADNFSLDN